MLEFKLPSPIKAWINIKILIINPRVFINTKKLFLGLIIKKFLNRITIKVPKIIVDVIKEIWVVLFDFNIQ